MKMHGAETGRARPEWPVTVRTVDEETGRLSEESLKLVFVPQKWEQRFAAWALRYLSQAHLFGGAVPEDDRYVEESLLKLSYALRKADGQQRFPFPQNLFDETRRTFNADLLNTLEIRDQLAPGEAARLAREYRTFLAVECSPSPSQAEWEALVEEGKTESLRTLLLRRGSSAILPALPGLDALYRASAPTSG